MKSNVDFNFSRFSVFNCEQIMIIVIARIFCDVDKAYFCIQILNVPNVHLTIWYLFIILKQ